MSVKKFIIDLTANWLSVTGKPIKVIESPEDTVGRNQSLGEALANFLVSDTKEPSEAIKFFTWARDLAEGKKLTLDQGDYTKLEKFVENNEKMTALLRAQVLLSFQESKGKAK